MPKSMSKFLLFLLFLISCNKIAGIEEKKEVEKIQFDTIAIEAKFKRNVLLKSKWSAARIPDVVICDDFISLSQVKRSLKFWENIGYTFGDVRVGEPYNDCMHEEPDRGVIRISLPTADQFKLLHDRLAVTHTTKFRKTGEIISVQIIMHDFAKNKKLTLEHEIGHALGWDHINKEGHIMNPEWKYVGDNTEGVTIDEYNAQSIPIKTPQ